MSARLSPFAAELEEGSAKPRQLPPKRSMAASNESRVLVLGSKNNVARIFPRQESLRYKGSSSIFSASEKSHSSSSGLKSPGSISERPLNIRKISMKRGVIAIPYVLTNDISMK